MFTLVHIMHVFTSVFHWVMISHYVVIFESEWRDGNVRYDVLKLHIIWQLSYLKSAMVLCNSATNKCCCWIFPKDHSKPSVVNFNLNKRNNISFRGVPYFASPGGCGLKIVPWFKIRRCWVSKIQDLVWCFLCDIYYLIFPASTRQCLFCLREARFSNRSFCYLTGKWVY